MNTDSNNSDLLKDLFIAAPCTMRWEDMAQTGNDAVRSCHGCSKNVFNITSMTRSQAEELLSKNGQQACLMLYRRADGTIMTDDCPVGLRRIRNFGRNILRTASSVAAFVISSVTAFAQPAEDSSSAEDKQEVPIVRNYRWFNHKLVTTPDQRSDVSEPVSKANPKLSSDRANLSSRPTRTVLAVAPIVATYGGGYFQGYRSGGVPAASFGQATVGLPILHRPTKSPYETSADWKAYNVYCIAKHDEKIEEYELACSRYQNALELLKDAKHDSGFRKRVTSEYALLLRKLGKNEEAEAVKKGHKDAK